MARPASTRRVSRRRYWRNRVNAARAPSEKFSEAVDYLRSEAAQHPDQRHARSKLEQAANDLEATAEELGKRAEKIRRANR